MIGMNIADLRKRNDMTQEELAERLSVSRQTLAKWERGESEPDLSSCIRISEIFQVTLDDLINYDREKGEVNLGIPPKGKYFFGSVTVGERGQIVIPQKARKIFKVEAGDQMLVFGDEEQGIGLVPKSGVVELMKMVFGGEKEEK